MYYAGWQESQTYHEFYFSVVQACAALGSIGYDRELLRLVLERYPRGHRVVVPGDGLWMSEVERRPVIPDPLQHFPPIGVRVERWLCLHSINAEPAHHLFAYLVTVTTTKTLWIKIDINRKPSSISKKIIYQVRKQMTNQKHSSQKLLPNPINLNNSFP